MWLDPDPWGPVEAGRVLVDSEFFAAMGWEPNQEGASRWLPLLGNSMHRASVTAVISVARASVEGVQFQETVAGPLPVPSDWSPEVQRLLAAFERVRRAGA